MPKSFTIANIWHPVSKSWLRPGCLSLCFQVYTQLACSLMSVFLFVISLKCSHIFSGIHLTGMYFNPANATQQTFGCHGTSPPEHIFVYWVGPLLGCSCAVKLHAQMRAWWKGGAIETSDSAAATDIPAKDHGKALDQKTIEGNGNVMEVNYNHQSGDAQLKAKTD